MKRLVLLCALLAACGSTDVVQCTTPDECPGVDNECMTRVCTADHKCLPTFTARGVPLSIQTEGDCTRRVCDGSGGLADVVDNSDLPHDDNACTIDACANGMPVHEAAALGTSCGAGLSCDSDGVCRGCLNWTQCPGQDTECQTRTCSQTGVCGFSFAAAGKPRSVQVAGDCHKLVCNGEGGTSEVVDDTDLPNDSNPCTTDVCTGGASSHPPVAAGTACGTGLSCDGATHCVGCTSPSECPGSDGQCKARTCSGTGVCGVSYQPAGTTCNENGGTMCNASGACI